MGFVEERSRKINKTMGAENIPIVLLNSVIT